MSKAITVAAFIEQAIRKSRKTQKQIGAEVGFPNPNVVSMLKQGITKLPLTRVPAMADALEVSRRELLHICLSEYFPDVLQVLDEILPGALLDNDETRFIAALRSMGGLKKIVPASSTPE